jgi:hypothetical protein
MSFGTIMMNFDGMNEASIFESFQGCSNPTWRGLRNQGITLVLGDNSFCFLMTKMMPCSDGPQAQ